MPVTIRTADHSTRQWHRERVTSDDILFEQSCYEEHNNSQRIIRSSFSHPLESNHVTGASNGFVDALFYAYCHHHDFTVRPEDIWFAILSQVSFYINANAEKLRAHFVAHDGRKELRVYANGTLETVDFGAIALALSTAIQNNVVDPDLRAWVMPEFSTTTENDRVVAAILLMGSMQKYFSFSAFLLCGIPTVTMLGERRDWEMLVEKLDRLPALGDEPARFAALLRPVLTRFVACFDDPTGPAAREFWGRCVHRLIPGSGEDFLSGWITAFCFWNAQGQLIPDTGLHEGTIKCELDGVRYPYINTSATPPGFSSVPLHVNDNGVDYETMMVAGMIGIDAKSSGRPLEEPFGDETTGLDSLQPVAGWVMYHKKDKSEVGKDSQDKLCDF
ncbi:DUF4419 domain-containing protein [Aspergillus fijiensis CBS 313.89]|uniref:DUF4419 domain protein n=1 Tax=Aspergillus fijiensis CBS 313.89 TaxID=1448319 RepID=A0A8G1W3Y6_9EURO|nr:uncharacterized protein BO72DRAFT_395036 [Aspergillus fijiensis CBS 313.89]RAK82051.1 hypothetical protein BO72DRAFT_395036 [Aspergillus fijiensis CBS 313.89]